MSVRQTTGLNEVTYQGSVDLRRDPPLGPVVRTTDVASYQVSELGNPHDEGIFWALAGPEINGAAEFSLGLYKMLPNQIHPPHYHPIGPEFYYIVEGSCLVLVDEEWIEAGPETAIYLPEGTVHAVRTREDESVTIFYGYDRRPDSEVSTVWLESS